MVQKIAAFDFGDILYFLILIIGGIFSWIQKTNENKKKTAPKTSSQPPTANDRKTANPLEEFLKNIEQQIQPKPEPVESVFDNSENTQQETQNKPILNYKFNDGFANISTEKEEVATKQESNFYPQYETNETIENLDVKKLIIADAILNKPYP